METKVHSLDDYEDDDDVFYDELRRQVMQLTAEDDDVGHEDVYGNRILNGMEARKQGPYHGPCSAPQSCYYSWPGIKEGRGETPAWMLSLWRSVNGTGVFIPRTLQSRTQNRSRRKNERGRTYKRVERMN